MKRGEKSKIVIELMEANRDKSYDVVSSMIEQKLGITNKAARAYYQYMVHNGKVTGLAITWGRGQRIGAAKPKATKSAKAPKIAKVAKSVTATVKSVDEIEAIKQKNLETMRKVSAKLSKVRDFTQPKAPVEATSDYDPRMDHDEERALLASEGYTNKVPRYANED